MPAMSYFCFGIAALRLSRPRICSLLVLPSLWATRQRQSVRPLQGLSIPRREPALCSGRGLSVGDYSGWRGQAGSCLHGALRMQAKEGDGRSAAGQVMLLPRPTALRGLHVGGGRRGVYAVPQQDVLARRGLCRRLPARLLTWQCRSVSLDPQRLHLAWMHPPCAPVHRHRAGR